MIRDLPVDLIQVSAYGATGDNVTYPTARLPKLLNPHLAGHDTLTLWRDAAADGTLRTEQRKTLLVAPH